jgi:glycerophosphoryl diester phosphodiesterase
MIKVAHRGTSPSYPDNSRLGIQFAIDHKIDWIEVDLQVTADSKFVLLHNYFLYPKLKIWGRLQNQKWDKIANIPLIHRGIVTTEYIPLAIEIIPEITKHAIALIDIKSGIKNHQLENFIQKLLTNCDVSRIVFATRSLSTLMLIKKVAPSCKSALFFSASMIRLLFFGHENSRCDYLLIYWRFCNKFIVKLANKLKIPIILSSPKSAKLEYQAKQLNVEGYFIYL